MGAVEKFMHECQAVVTDYTNGTLDHTAAGARLEQLRLPKSAHPMLRFISDTAFELADDCGRVSAAEKADLWQAVINAFESYKKGDWYSTCWVLAATYCLRKDGKTVKGFGIAVRRQNGATIVEAGEPVLRRRLEAVVAKVNNKQTDQWYLRNVAHMLPPTIGRYELVESSVDDGLVGRP